MLIIKIFTDLPVLGTEHFLKSLLQKQGCCKHYAAALFIFAVYRKITWRKRR